MWFVPQRFEMESFSPQCYSLEVLLTLSSAAISEQPSPHPTIQPVTFVSPCGLSNRLIGGRSGCLDRRIILKSALATLMGANDVSIL